MDTLVGMPRTGRKVLGPAADLVELIGPRGVKCQAIQVHPAFRQHPSLGSSIDSVLGFLEKTGVPGLVDLHQRDRAAGAFVYPTGTVWSVHEVVRKLADQGRVGGIKAGLELCWLIGQILDELGRVGPPQGVYAHGNVSPWRVMLRPDGQALLIGCSVPQPDVLVFLEDETSLPAADALRYCPPERLLGSDEDVSSDVFCLVLVAFELMTGTPVYDGLVADLRHQATRAEGARRLYQIRDRLPESVREVLSRALKYDPDARWQDPAAFVRAVHGLLGAPDVAGPSLIQLMTDIVTLERKARPNEAGNTGAHTPEDLAAMVGGPARSVPSEPPPPEVVAEPEERPRWGRPARRSADAAAPAPAPAVPPPAREPRGDVSDLRPRRLRPGPSGRSDADVPPPAPPAAPSPAPPAPAPAAAAAPAIPDAPRRRRRLDESAAMPITPVVSAAVAALEDDEDEKLLARLRGGRRTSAEPITPPPAAPAPPPAAAAPPAAPPPAAPPPAPAPPPPAAAPPAAPPKAAAPPASAPSPRITPPARPSRADDEAPIAFQVVLPGGGQRKARVRPADSVADAVSRLVSLVAPAPVDLTGRLTHWYRAAQDGRLVPGDAAVRDLDPARPLELVLVPNDVVRLEVIADGARFQSMVALATPSRMLVAHLCAWLGLPGDGWALRCGRALGPNEVLAEVAPRPGDTLIVERRG